MNRTHKAAEKEFDLVNKIIKDDDEELLDRYRCSELLNHDSGTLFDSHSSTDPIRLATNVTLIQSSGEAYF